MPKSSLDRTRITAVLVTAAACALAVTAAAQSLPKGVPDLGSAGFAWLATAPTGRNRRPAPGTVRSGPIPPTRFTAIYSAGSMAT
jgi:hypothetical protein